MKIKKVYKNYLIYYVIIKFYYQDNIFYLIIYYQVKLILFN